MRALFTDELWEERGTRLLADVTWAPRDAPTPHELRRAYAAAAAAPEPAPLARPPPRRCCACWPRARPSPHAGSRSFAGCGVRWLIEHILRPGRSTRTRADAPRLARHAVLERTLALLRERTGSARIAPERLDAALDRARTSALAERRGAAAAAGARRALLRGLEADLERYLRTEAECGAGYEPAVLEWSFGGDGRRPPRSRSATRRRVTGRVDRVDVGPAARAIVRDYKGRTVTAARSGPRTSCSSRSRSTCSRSASCSGSSRRRRSTSRSAAATWRPRGLVRDDVPGRYAHRRRRRRRLRGGAGGGARARRRTAADLRAGGSGRAPSAARPAAAATRRSAGRRAARRSPAAHAEQRAAIADRGRSSLLAAGAGSGKTAVMVERFAEAVLRDGVAGRLDPDADVHREGRGRAARAHPPPLRRARRARARPRVDAAWIGTIHGFCARVLRTQPLAAGLDPRFTVLDEAAAQRLANAAYDDALEAWAPRHGAPRSTSPPPTAGTSSRSSSTPTPRCAPGATPAAPARDPAAAPAARPRARSPPRPRRRVRRAAPGDARPRDRGARRAGGVRAADRRAGAAALAARARRGESCRAAPRRSRRRLRGLPRRLGGLPRACADHHAHGPRWPCSTSCSTASAPRTRRPRRERAGVDFEDLELRVRDLLAGDEALRARWAERFALIMIDEFQDTNRLQLDVLEALERDNLFAVGDESQSIYGFRHADVGIFRAAGRARPGRGAPPHGQLPLAGGDPGRRQRGVRAGARRRLRAARRPDARRRSCGCSRRTRRRRRASSCSSADDRGLGGREAELGLAALAAQPGAAPRRARSPRGCAPRSTPAGRRRHRRARARDGSLRLYEQALEEQGLPTYVVGGRGYWSQEQVRDGLAYLALLANPHDEAALSPRSPRRSAAPAPTR